MRRKLSLFAAAALAAAAPLLGSSCAQAAQAQAVPKIDFDPPVIIPVSLPKTDAGVDVTLACWNVEGLDRGGSAPLGTYDGVARAAMNSSVEIAAFEEVQTDDATKLKAALSKAGCDLPYFSISTQSDGFNAYAVASRYPITEAVEILPPSSKTWPRSLFKVSLDIGKGLTLIVCHLKAESSGSPGLAKREAQAKALANYLRESFDEGIESECIVTLGDMNTVFENEFPGSSSTIDLLRLADDSIPENDFTSLPEFLLPVSDCYTWEGYTRSRLDHILLSPAAMKRLVPNTLRVYRSDPDTTMTANSDHYPLLLDLSL
jgi:endonuclease/exonuclease/phosphatase family metal-dependent hydrolase